MSWCGLRGERWRRGASKVVQPFRLLRVLAGALGCRAELSLQSLDGRGADKGDPDLHGMRTPHVSHLCIPGAFRETSKR